MNIEYRVGFIPDTDDIINIYTTSGLLRPVSDIDRINTMYKNSNIVVTAWNGESLIGIVRALSDFSYCCYISDLAVDSVFQKQGIGTKLIEAVHQIVGDKSNIILIAAPNAIDYYEKIGFEKLINGFIIKRKI